MTTTTTSGSNAFTVDDLESLPADGRRYELIGGAIVMTPAGVPAYWIVDPQRGLLLALQLTAGEYVANADTPGPVELDWPLRVSLEAVSQLAGR